MGTGGFLTRLDPLPVGAAAVIELIVRGNIGHWFRCDVDNAFRRSGEGAGVRKVDSDGIVASGGWIEDPSTQVDGLETGLVGRSGGDRLVE
jgi:hypothetical protein